jgi:hypothetical protein
MPTLAIVAEVDPLTEHLVLLIIVVAVAGVLLLIILLAMVFLGSAWKDRATPGREPERAKATEPSQTQSDQTRIRLEPD